MAAVAHSLRSGKGFDCIFMDLHMPRMDGIDATKAILQLARDRHARAPVLFGLTADTMASAARKFLASGVRAVLLKPFGTQKLQQAALEAKKIHADSEREREAVE